MFDNLEDARLRAILETSSIDPDDIEYAMAVTHEAVTLDAEDDDVPHKAVEHRVNAFDNAWEAWDEGDARRCIDMLRECWSW